MNRISAMPATSVLHECDEDLAPPFLAAFDYTWVDHAVGFISRVSALAGTFPRVIISILTMNLTSEAFAKETAERAAGYSDSL